MAGSTFPNDDEWQTKKNVDVDLPPLKKEKHPGEMRLISLSQCVFLFSTYVNKRFFLVLAALYEFPHTLKRYNTSQ